MAIITRSREAEAAQRFVEASRGVDLAFRAVRGESEEAVSPMTYGAAQFRLELALDELARAEALFDSVIRIQGRNHRPDHMDT
ncbi:hypothetical protein [Paraburkholderia dinghuensis]|uniref:Uncharacterized protein n=1 Tax=Paraburkholderia dinghuensis TaxID=2305225 RepID=A0A3N6PRA8_9BURK|nr:hypothetical protein [Paraburkholderia dinghuensis]RQH04480.1 hypothetical protein D1Y85_18670 [Paraburkholderia dinghuensis]